MALVAHVRRHMAGGIIDLLGISLFRESSLNVSFVRIPSDEILRSQAKTPNGFCHVSPGGAGANAVAAAVVAVIAVTFSIAVATRTQRDDGMRGLGCSRHPVQVL